MDLFRAIQELHAERRRVVGLIQAVEEVRRYYGSLPAPKATSGRRGRKSMGRAERQEVSERMKKYWANRRAAQEGQDWAATG